MKIFERLFGQRARPEAAKKFENFLTNEIPRQYEASVTSLRKVGLLEEMFAGQEDELIIKTREGITAMDGKKYEIPSAEKIAKHFSAEKYQEKFEQGFTKLLIVPFGYPLATLRIRYAQQLISHHRDKKLLDQDNRTLELDKKSPIYVWNKFDNTDETNGMIYYPKQFDRINHGGKTKQELLDDNTQPFPGFHVLLIKPDLVIPGEGAGKTTGTRTDLETNKSSIDYLKLLTRPQYRQERGFTIEDSIVLAMTHLDQTNQVIDNWQNKRDSQHFNIGNLHLASGVVVSTCWDRASQQAYVGGNDPRSSHAQWGARVAVG